MAAKNSKIKIKPFKFGRDPQPSAVLKIGVSLESVNTTSSQLAGLVLSLVKFELIRRDAYQRWHVYLNQVGLRLRDLIAYLNVLHDDDQLIQNLKNYYYRSQVATIDRTELIQEAYELKEQLIDKIKQVKILSDFSIHKIRKSEQILE